VWAAVATGVHPSGNGIRSAARYYALRDRRGVALLPDHSLSHALVHLGFVRDVPLRADAWLARPVWGILTDAGMTSGIVRWPLTHPTPPSAGFIVSDQLHQALGSIGEFARAGFPSDILRDVQVATDSAGLVRTDAALPGFPPGSPEHAAFQRDLLYSRVANALQAARQPDLFAIRYEGLDMVAHHYLRHAQGQRTRDVSEEERRRRAQIVARYYAFIDAELGAMLARMVPGDLLMVISGFGMEPLTPFKRIVGWVLRDPAFTGTHDRAPDGFLLAYGSAVQPGRPPRGSIVDVTPTLLYFFGLPVARDMDGYARADLFTEEFTAERPITFIPTYR
jgi:predicted AlkP superfamily phosphohydrolase/phosphomutase